MPTMNRRSFLKGMVALGAGAVLYQYADGSYRIVLANGAAVDYSMRVVHTNDHHARIEPVSLTIGSGNPAPARNFGGVARRKTLFEQIKTANPGTRYSLPRRR